MKKIIGLVIIMAGVVLAQGSGEAYKIIEETVGTTNYIGLARTTTSSNPSTNDAVWKIIRTITPSSGNSTTANAYGSGSGDNALWTNSWTNRVNATYK